MPGAELYPFTTSGGVAVALRQKNSLFVGTYAFAVIAIPIRVEGEKQSNENVSWKYEIAASPALSEQGRNSRNDK